MQLILHRDGDFLTESERQFWSRPYEEKGIRVWITPGSDVEACFLEAKVLAKTLGTSVENAQKLLEDAVSKSEEENSKKFSEKRDSHRRNNKLRSAGSSIPSDDEVRQELQTGSVIGTSVGKKIAKTLRGLTQDEFEGSSKIGKHCPLGSNVAPELRTLLESVIQPNTLMRRRRRSRG